MACSYLVKFGASKGVATFSQLLWELLCIIFAASSDVHQFVKIISMIKTGTDTIHK